MVVVDFLKAFLELPYSRVWGAGLGNAISVLSGIPGFLFSLIFRVPSFGLNMILIVRGHFDVRDITVKLSRQLRESQF